MSWDHIIKTKLYFCYDPTPKKRLEEPLYNTIHEATISFIHHENNKQIPEILERCLDLAQHCQFLFRAVTMVNRKCCICQSTVGAFQWPKSYRFKIEWRDYLRDNFPMIHHTDSMSICHKHFAKECFSNFDKWKESHSSLKKGEKKLR